MKSTCAVVFVLIGLAAGQNVSISPGALQTNPKQLSIQVDGMGDKQFEAFFGPQGPGSHVNAYHVYVITHQDEPEMRVDDRTSDYLPSTATTQAGMSQVQVPLLRPLRADETYLIVVTGIGKAGRVIGKIDAKGKVLTSNESRIADEVKVAAPVPISNRENDIVKIERKKATPQGDIVASTPETIDARVSRIDADGLLLELVKPLPSGSSSVSVKGLQDSYGNPISAEGKIDVTAAPANDSDAYVLATVAANAAVHQAPVFTLTARVAPLHPSIHAVFWGPVRVDPSTAIDIGLRSTKSANSIIVPAPFNRAVILGLPKPNNSDGPLMFRKVNPFAMQFMFGPRIETDRNFQRLNSLGELRWELYIPGFSKDMSARKAKLSALQPQYRDFLELPNRGYTFAPYFQFDGGAHVNEETVTNGKTKDTVTVPSHTISRAYFGVKGTLQYWLASVDLDASFVDMFQKETIGYTTNTQALLRQVEGWQPHTKLNFAVSFSKAKHEAFNVTFENGRTAPNFEYLNKVDVGFKVIY